MDVEIVVPSAGESVTEGQIAEWLKAVGDPVVVDEIVVLIETDKVTVELPSPATGVLKKILAQKGETVRIHQVIGIVEATSAAVGTAKPAFIDKPTPAAAPAAASETAGPIASPAARRLAEEKGVALKAVAGTGRGGRVLKEDVQTALETAQTKAPAAPAPAPATAKAAPPARAPLPAGPRQEERVKMTPLRRRIAERLMHSQQSTATLTTFNEIDMSAAMDLRARYGEAFQKRYGVKLGFMSLFTKAAIEALKAFPAVNAEIQGDEIVYKNYYDIGVAVSTDRGLVVPIVRDAHLLSLAEIELAVAELSRKAREGKLTIEDLSGGTFSISNGGIFGSLLSTPILNPPQSAILGLHKIEKRPVVVAGDQIAVRPMMYVALSYDHRIIDGREAVSFLVRIKECMEDPVRVLVEV